ncbi:MAG: tetratricopeptide repeat protein [Archangium sp.]
MLSLVLISVLAAPMPGDAEAARFKAAFERGEALFQAGDFGAAISNFKEADRARATPEVAYDLAKCFERLGDEAYTLYYYRLYLRRAPNAPDTLEVAEKVGIVIARLEAEGKGVLELDAPRADAVTFQGHVYPTPPVAAFLPPGDYVVSAKFPSGEKTMSVQIRTGKTTSVSFEPVQPPMLHLEDALSADQVAQGVETAPSTGPKPLRVASYVVAAAGLAALAAGATLGVLANGDKANAQDKSLTIAQAQNAADAANGKALGANLLFGVGGAAVVGGALMFVFSMPEPGMKSGASK